MANPWLAHVKKTMKMMKKNKSYKKGKGLKQVIDVARESYKKHRGGLEKDVDSSSDDEEVVKPDPSLSESGQSAGRRRRRSTGGRTRRHRRR